MPTSRARDSSRRTLGTTASTSSTESPISRSGPSPERSAERIEAERSATGELAAWRASAIPDPSASFDADSLAKLVRDCYAALGIDSDVGAGFSVNTVHFYRRKDILDEPAGRTSAARYDIRHLWQAVGARLAGYLGLVTLAEAREVIRGADEATLLAFVAARVVDARARARMRAAATRPVPAASRMAPEEESAVMARPLPGVRTAASLAAPRAASADSPSPQARVIPLPGEAWCILPASHPAHSSPSSARELVLSLADALRVQLR